LWLCFLGVAVAAGPRVVRTGIVDTLFRDTPRSLVDSSIEGFKALMEEETGVKTESDTLPDIWVLGEQLENGKVQLGVCNGYEFAWLRQKDTSLRPLVIAVNQQRDVRAHVLVRANTGINDLAALRGKSLAIPLHTKSYCRLFLERECLKAGQDMEHYFSKFTAPANLEDALDDVVDGAVDAAVVDTVGLSRYRHRKPARAAKLKEVAASPTFPPSAVIYRPGGMDQETLASFRKALLRFSQTAPGRQILQEWKLTGLEPVPKNYEAGLDAIAKIYPPDAKK
jgi:ABC-type phosphate/phosphonate transport system substrate-binding protein